MEKSSAGMVHAVRSVTVSDSNARWNLSFFEEGQTAITSQKCDCDRYIITESGYCSFKITAVDLLLDEDMYYYYSWYAY